MARRLAALQGRFNETARISEDEFNRRTDRIRDLQAENERQQEEIVKLRRQNTRLRETAAARGGSHDDLEEKLRLVTEERDKLKKHLKRANRYIHTLLANNVRDTLTK